MRHELRAELFLSWVSQAQRPYGTSLGPEDFEIIDGKLGSFVARATALNEVGEQTVYELHMNPKLLGAKAALCVVNKTQMLFLDPYTERSQGIVAEASDWFSWILKQDAAGRIFKSRPESPWEGDSIEAMIRRAEANIVGYAEAWTHSDNFGDLAQLQMWLDMLLEVSPAKATVVSLVPANRDGSGPVTDIYDLHMVFDSTSNSLVIDDEGCSNETPVGTVSLSASELLWLPDELGEDGKRIESSIDVLMNGATVERANGHGAALINKSAALIAKDQRNVRLKKAQRWCGIRFEGAPQILIFPRFSTTLQLSLDQDGALAALRAFPDEKIAKHRRADWEFRQRWGRWLDESVVFTQAELDEGVIQAERLLHSNK